MSTRPSILLVSGPPASGKSTLAALLHQRLPSFSLIAKDMLKEELFDALRTSALVPGDFKPEGLASVDALPSMERVEADRDPLAYSRKLSTAAMELLWSIAPHCRNVILEANFRPHSAHERARLQALPGHKLEIFCRCSIGEIERRFRERAGGRHPAHVLQAITPAMLAEYQSPFALSPVVEVSSEAPFSADAVLAQIREHWPDIEISGAP